MTSQPPAWPSWRQVQMVILGKMETSSGPREVGLDPAHLERYVVRLQTNLREDYAKFRIVS